MCLQCYPQGMGRVCAMCACHWSLHDQLEAESRVSQGPAIVLVNTTLSAIMDDQMCISCSELALPAAYASNNHGHA